MDGCMDGWMDGWMNMYVGINQLLQLPFRGVQYVHWVMHKCIMVKVGGENIRKVCKGLLNFWKTGGNFEKKGGNNKFSGIKGEMY